MLPTFENYQEGHGAELRCPSCGNNYLHHETIEIWERGEDKECGLHIVIDDGKSSIDTDLKGNPSMRRHGLTIAFSCEGCSARPVLSFTQHKGNTCVDFI